MGTPIDSRYQYTDYTTLSLLLRGADYRRAFTKNGRTEQYLQGKQIKAEGAIDEKNAYIVIEDYNSEGKWAGMMIYSTAYKPKQLRDLPKDDYDGYVPLGNYSTRNLPFTQIYQTEIDDKTGKRFYIKAEDINGDGDIQENEITRFNNKEEFDNSLKKDGLYSGEKDNWWHFPMGW